MRYCREYRQDDDESDGDPLISMATVKSNLSMIGDIRERMSSEIDRERLLGVIERSLNEIFMFDPDTLRFEFVNLGARTNLGYGLEELRSMTPIDLKPEFSEESFREMIGPLLRGERDILVFDSVHRRANGSLYPVEVRLQLDDQTGGRIVLAVVTDTTERKRAEELLSRYQLLSSEARDIMWFVRASDGAILEANAAAEAAYGYSREELLRLTMNDIRAADDGPTIDLQMEAASTGGILFETEHHRKDGSSFPVEVSSRGATMIDGEKVLLSVIRDISERKHTEAALVESSVRLKLTLQAAVAALGATAELRDPYTAGHQRRVAKLACAIADELGWEEHRIEMLRTAALLHDIGKIVVPTELLSKPGRLNPTEMLLIQAHAAAGAETVADIDFGGAVAAAIGQHHERLDGSGYPGGLSEEEILPEARALAVADVVEAMISHRPYRPALPLEAALHELENGTGSRYDGEVCAACLRLFREKDFALGD